MKDFIKDLNKKMAAATFSDVALDILVQDTVTLLERMGIDLTDAIWECSKDIPKNILESALEETLDAGVSAILKAMWSVGKSLNLIDFQQNVQHNYLKDQAIYLYPPITQSSNTRSVNNITVTSVNGFDDAAGIAALPLA